MRKRLNPDLQDFRINRISNNPVGARLALALKYAHSFTTQTNGEHTMRTPLKSIATAALTRPLSILFILLIGAIGVQTITSCSGGADDLPCVTCGDDGGGSSPSSGNNSSSSGTDNGGGGGDPSATFAIKNVTNSSFTIVYRDDECQEDGTLKNTPYESEESYSINGATLLWGVEFNGNPSSPNRPYGTWTREAFSASCEEDDWGCKDNNRIPKVVFTENSVTFTMCFGKTGEEREYDYDGVIKRKYIACGTYEETKGMEMVRVKYSETEFTATYNGKTCTWPLFDGYYYYSESQMEKACKEAHDNNGDYREILDKDLIKCLKDKNFPVWWGPN